MGLSYPTAATNSDSQSNWALRPPKHEATPESTGDKVIDCIYRLRQEIIGVLCSAIVNVIVLILLCLFFVQRDTQSEIEIEVTFVEPATSPQVQVVVPKTPSKTNTAEEESASEAESDTDQATDNDQSAGEPSLFELVSAFQQTDMTEIEIAEAGSTAAATRSGGNSGSNGSGLDAGSTKKEVRFHGVRGSASRIVYVVDASASMAGVRFGRTRKELVASIEQLDPSQSFGVVFFQSLRVISFPPNNTLAHATELEKEHFKNWVRRVSPKGGTYPSAALRKAFAFNPEVVFFLTDGLIPEKTVRVGVHSAPHGTTIHTIAFVTSAGEAMLKEIAEKSGGQYRFVP